MSGYGVWAFQTGSRPVLRVTGRKRQTLRSNTALPVLSPSQNTGREIIPRVGHISKTSSREALLWKSDGLDLCEWLEKSFLLFLAGKLMRISQRLSPSPPGTKAQLMPGRDSSLIPCSEHRDAPRSLIGTDKSLGWAGCEAG